ncbi:MAG: tRNA lysidine(34) synthetase TilS [Chloroflexota bacterium]|nr:MAG: tRNA lysidine(34) synthetase TilS [Chloroflexota bacterium]
MPPAPIAPAILERIRRGNRRARLIQPGDVIVVAVSGGADSLCLLQALFDLRDELGVQLHVAHLDHLLRGAESMAAAYFVRDLARAMELPFHLAHIDVGGYRREHRLSLEEAARQVRYGFLDNVARRAGAAAVAVGHTASDQTETVLLHLLRGTGLTGLRGMPDSSELRLPDGREVHVVRPLLSVWRDECLAFCEERGLRPQIDASNLDLSYTRNRIRLELLPTLRQYNPRIEEGLLRLTSAAGAAIEIIEEAVDEVWDSVAEPKPSYVVLHRARLRSLKPALQSHIVLRAIDHLLGDLREIAAIHVEDVLAALDKTSGVQLSLPRQLVLTLEYDRAILGFADDADCPLPSLDGPCQLPFPGELDIAGWHVSGRVESFDAAGRAPSRDRWTADLDADRAGTELAVRSRRPGDRFQPLGMAQMKSVQDFMVDAKIPRSWRARVPIVESAQQIVWLAGWRIDERVKVGPATRQVLHVEFSPRYDE